MKPYHLMTPAERTAARIAKNKAIDVRVEEAKRKLKQIRLMKNYIAARGAFQELLSMVCEEDRRELLAIWNRYGRNF